MTAEDTFDRRLGEALLAYAADAAIEPDPTAFAVRIATAHPRSRLAAIASRLRRSELRLLWLALALLLIVSTVGVVLMGMRPREPQPLVFTDAPIPDELFGRWVMHANGRPDRYLDLNLSPLLHERDGRGLDSLGSVVGFVPSRPGSIEGTVVIHSSSGCGDASYRLSIDDTPAGPTAAPAPSLIQTAPPRPSILAAFRLTDPVDSCPERASILANHSWSRLSVHLETFGAYDSLDFGEPFHLTVPADAADGLFSATVGTMYQDRPNQLRISHAWWSGAFVDDIPVNRVPCRPELGTLPDIPASVDEVGAWLATATDVRFRGPTELVVDGRRALRWEIGDVCSTESAAVSDLATGYEYYAIPTGDDVILFVVRADTANESKVAERIVLALRFD